MVRGPDADRAQSRQAAPVLPARVPPRFRLGDSCLRSRLRRSGTAARRRAPRLDGLSTNARVYFRGHLAAAGASTPESVARRSDSLSRPFVSKPSRPHEPDPYRDDPGPTPETRAKLQPDPIRALLEAGVIDGPQAGAAEEIRDIIEALVGRAYGPAMREVPRPRARKVSGRTRHPLDNLPPWLHEVYAERYIPWAGDIARRRHLGDRLARDRRWRRDRGYRPTSLVAGGAGAQCAEGRAR